MIRPVADFLADLRASEAAGEVSPRIARAAQEHVARAVTAETADLPGPRGSLDASVLSFPDQVQNYVERATAQSGPGVPDAPGAGVALVLLMLARTVLVLGIISTVVLLWTAADNMSPYVGSPERAWEAIVMAIETGAATAVSSAVLFGLHAALVLLRRIDAAVGPAGAAATKSGAEG